MLPLPESLKTQYVNRKKILLPKKLKRQNLFVAMNHAAVLQVQTMHIVVEIRQKANN